MKVTGPLVCDDPFGIFVDKASLAEFWRFTADDRSRKRAKADALRNIKNEKFIDFQIMHEILCRRIALQRLLSASTMRSESADSLSDSGGEEFFLVAAWK